MWVGDGAGASCGQGCGFGVAAGCLAAFAWLQGGIEYPLLKGAHQNDHPGLTCTSRHFWQAIAALPERRVLRRPRVRARRASISRISSCRKPQAGQGHAFAFARARRPGPWRAPRDAHQGVLFMTAPSNHHDASLDLLAHNQAAWDQQAAQDCEWSRPVTPEIIAAARGGDLSAARLTPEPLPRGWLDAVRGLRILCLACAGGQQAPVLAAAGADVTVFDLSEGQLDQDRAVARREGLALTAVQGDMRDLSASTIRPSTWCSTPSPTCTCPTCGPCGASAFACCGRGPAAVQLLQPGGVRGRPRSAIRGAGPDPAGARAALRGHAAPGRRGAGCQRARGEALVFGHTLQDQIGGQLDAGFLLAGFRSAPAPAALRDRWLSADLPGHLGRQAGLSAPAGAAISPARAGRCCRARPARAPGAGCPDRHRPASATAVPGPAGPSDASANGWCSGR